MTDQLPADGEQNGIKIQRFEIGEREERFSMLRAAAGHHGEGIAAGTYVRLLVGGGVMMSNTPVEAMESESAVRRAFGRMLIGGLGLGIMLHPILESDDVEHVTVVECHEDIIALVTPSLQRWIDSGKLEIVLGDVFTWKPPRGTKYQCCWFDVWPDLCSDYFGEANKLKRRFSRRLERSERLPDTKPWVDTWLDRAKWRMRW